MEDRALFQATYSDFRLVRSRKVVQFVFEVPIEGANQACDVLGGMPNPAEEIWCIIARLDMKKASGPLFETKAPAVADPKPKTPRAPVAAEKRLAQRAGILCAELPFRKFLEGEINEPVLSEEAAATALRKFCGVSSRSEIVVGTEEGHRFEQLLGRYEGWKADIE
jgi:hypothetical protein